MDPEQNGSPRQGMKKRFTFERLALVGILGLQVAILVRTTKNDEAVKFDRIYADPRPSPVVSSAQPAPWLTPSTPETATASSITPTGPASAKPPHLAEPTGALFASPLEADEAFIFEVPTALPPFFSAYADPGIMRARMDRALAGVMADFERLESVLSFDEGWSMLRSCPAVDMRDAAERYVVTMSLPEIDRDRLAVTLDGRLLTVATRDGGTFRTAAHRFEHRILLPGTVQAAGATAFLTNGILRVEIPKAASETSENSVARNIF